MIPWEVDKEAADDLVLIFVRVFPHGGIMYAVHAMQSLPMRHRSIHFHTVTNQSPFRTMVVSS
jgi:hypothetical protein